MKRSEINKAILTAKGMMEKLSWTLPHWGYWSNEDYLDKTDSLLRTSQNADCSTIMWSDDCVFA